MLIVELSCFAVLLLWHSEWQLYHKTIDEPDTRHAANRVQVKKKFSGRKQYYSFWKSKCWTIFCAEQSKSCLANVFCQSF